MTLSDRFLLVGLLAEMFGITTVSLVWYLGMSLDNAVKLALAIFALAGVFVFRREISKLLLEDP